MVEVYANCESRLISGELLAQWQLGWQAVYEILRDLEVGMIASLPVIEISLLDDADMGRIHGEFLGDDRTTDVITFEHGELLVGVQTAERQAAEYGSTFERELALYGIHGMLHLAGFDDQAPDDARRMAARQEELLDKVFGDL